MEASFREYFGRLVGFYVAGPVDGVGQGKEKKRKIIVELLKYRDRTFFFFFFFLVFHFFALHN